MKSPTLPPAADLECAVSRLLPARRFRFLLSEGAEHARLLLRPLRSSQPETLPGGQLHVGVGWVAADGRLVLAGTTLNATLMEKLSDWIVEHTPSHPGLSALHHLRMAVTRDGRIDTIIERPTLWGRDVPSPMLGTPSAAAAAIAAVSMQEPAWLWMQQDTLLILPQSTDPERQTLTRLVRVMCTEAPMVAGVLTRLPTGLHLSTRGDVGPARAQLDAFIKRHGRAFPALRQLSLAPIVQPDAETILAVSPGRRRLRASADLQRSAQVISAAPEKTTLRFAYYSIGPGGIPAFITDTERDRLRDRVARASATAPGGTAPIRGQLRFIDGRARFQLRTPSADFIDSINTLVRRYRTCCPALARLEGAHLSISRSS